MRIKAVSILLFFVGVILFTSCSTTKHLKDGEFLLVRNVIVFDSVNPGIDKDDLSAIPQPRPNKKFLGVVPMRLWFYNMGLHGKQESGFRTWLREKVGSRPSLYEESLSATSINELKVYLNKIGYFHSEASFEVEKHKKKARVIYTIQPAVPYRIRNVDIDINDPVISSLFKEARQSSKVKTGSIFNAFNLDAERERLTDLLTEHGYYYFDRNYIYYELDSTLTSHQMDLTIKIKDFNRTSGAENTTAGHFSHYRYRINDIFIKPNYDDLIHGEGPIDTLLYTISHKAEDTSEYYIIYRNHLKIHPMTLTQSIFMKSGELYNSKDVRMSKIRLSEIGLYNYNNIRFKEIQTDDSTGIGELDCYIDLGRRKLHSFTIEAEGTNRGGRPGIGFNFSYLNSNIFRGSEAFRFRAHIALEAQKNLATGGSDVTGNIPFFNTIETGLDASITFPRFLSPIRQQRFSKYFRPKTTITTGFGYERRPEYTRAPIFLTFGYDWKESNTKRHILNPFDWNIVNVTLSPDFQETIDNEPNDRIRNQYTDHLITAISYAFIFNNQDINKLENFIFFRGDVETSGNLLYLGNSLFGTMSDSLNYYTVGGIRYSQYARIALDFRFYNVVTRNTTVVYRLFAGVGIPYGNAVVLPLEKGFYGGGANGMRGWPLRRLGPGSYSNPDDNFDKMGDMQLEANLEYRFPVYKFFKLGLFMDIGNIWLIQDNESYPGGVFKLDKFYKDFAIDAGLGIRLDFNFFILRVDGAIPVRDPAMMDGGPWAFSKWQLKDILINFGIGYPF